MKYFIGTESFKQHTMEGVRALLRLGLLRVATRELKPRLINTFILDRNPEP